MCVVVQEFTQTLQMNPKYLCKTNKIYFDCEFGQLKQGQKVFILFKTCCGQHAYAFINSINIK